MCLQVCKITLLEYPEWGHHWYDGCGLVTSSPGALPTGQWTQAARRIRKIRSRNDWGITMDSMGHIMFGHGTRAPLYVS